MKFNLTSAGVGNAVPAVMMFSCFTSCGMQVACLSHVTYV